MWHLIQIIFETVTYTIEQWNKSISMTLEYSRVFIQQDIVQKIMKFQIKASEATLEGIYFHINYCHDQCVCSR